MKNLGLSIKKYTDVIGKKLGERVIVSGFYLLINIANTIISHPIRRQISGNIGDSVYPILHIEDEYDEDSEETKELLMHERMFNHLSTN